MWEKGSILSKIIEHLFTLHKKGWEKLQKLWSKNGGFGIDFDRTNVL